MSYCEDDIDERYWEDDNDKPPPIWPLIFLVVFLFVVGFAACYFERR